MGINMIELLSPAGSYESFVAAIGAGADAVYVGGNRFGARAYANNFSHEELIEAIHTAHLYQRKLFLTLNTLIKESEMKELYDFLAPLYEAGLDAVIVQDLGAISFIRKQFPGLSIHASTQIILTAADGAKF
jgi:putative protease